MARLHVLWLSPVFPWPPTDGYRQRNYHLLREVAAAHDVTLVCPDAPHDPEARAEIERLCRVEAVESVEAAEADGSEPAFKVPSWLRAAVRGRPLFVPGELTQIRERVAGLAREGPDVTFGTLYV